MGKPEPPRPVKYIIGAIGSKREVFSSAKIALEEEIGAMDITSEVFDFDYTDYYQQEMGKDLRRKFYSVDQLMDPDKLAPVKLTTNDLEQKIGSEVSVDVDRPLNLDPGYIGYSKLVLATTKNYSHRIYLRDGIYAEVTLRYQEDQFEPFSWTYPDYRSQNYLQFFHRVRARYKEQLS